MHAASFAQLQPTTVYDLLQLRAQVFVVEQGSPYLDPDGRDTEPGTRHLWLTEHDEVVAYLRVVTEPDGSARVGRVCVAAHARRRGHARRLLTEALAGIGERPAHLAAQAHQTGFYSGFGFRVTGPPFDDIGVVHVPMSRLG